MSFYARFAAHYERVFPFRPATLAFLEERLPDRGLVLDLGCGPGHHAGALAARELDMVGLDLDEAMIAAARERYATARFVCADLTEVPTVTDHADGAYCIGNVLPHLPPDRRDRMLADLAAILAPGAPWIIQTVNFDRLWPLAEPHDLPPIDAGEGLVFTRRYLPAADRPGAVRFLTRLQENGQEHFAGETPLWPARAEDLARAHAAAGFVLVEQCGDFQAAPFDPGRSGGCIQVYRRQD